LAADERRGHGRVRQRGQNAWDWAGVSQREGGPDAGAAILLDRGGHPPGSGGHPPGQGRPSSGLGVTFLRVLDGLPSGLGRPLVSWAALLGIRAAS
jgi:hypothetical protein